MNACKALVRGVMYRTEPYMIWLFYGLGMDIFPNLPGGQPLFKALERAGALRGLIFLLISGPE